MILVLTEKFFQVDYNNCNRMTIQIWLHQLTSLMWGGLPLIKNTTSPKWNFRKMAYHNLLHNSCCRPHKLLQHPYPQLLLSLSPFILKYMISLISMISCPVLEAIDRCLSDCTGLRNIRFSCKTFVLGGNFQQTLRIVSRSHNFGCCKLLRQKLRPLK